MSFLRKMLFNTESRKEMIWVGDRVLRYDRKWRNLQGVKADSCNDYVTNAPSECVTLKMQLYDLSQELLVSRSSKRGQKCFSTKQLPKSLFLAKPVGNFSLHSSLDSFYWDVKPILIYIFLCQLIFSNWEKWSISKLINIWPY